MKENIEFAKTFRIKRVKQNAQYGAKYKIRN